MSFRFKSLVGLAAAAILTMTGCGAPSASTTAAAEPGAPVDLNVGYIPVGIYSYLWRAVDAGYFKDEKLNVKLVPMAGGGEIIPALQSGSLQFGISDALGVLNARNQDIPVSYVSFNYSQSASDPIHAVLTGDASVKSPKDLEGKTVATNLSYNTDWTMMREWLRKNDVDISKVTFQELPFPDMLAALRGGTVAAAGVTEPFYTQGEADGLRVLGNFFAEVKSPVVFSGVTSLEPYIKANPDVVKRFVNAVDRAIADFNADEKTVRDVIAANTKIAPAVIAKMHLGKWEAKASLSDIKFWVDAAEKEGILKNKVAPEDLLWQR